MASKGSQTPSYWYDGSAIPFAARLLAPVYGAVVALRRGLYRRGWRKRHALPVPVIGGLALVVFGLIAATGGRIWVQSKVDFSRPRNLITAGVALTAGAGDLTLSIAGFKMGGIGTATFGAIVLYHLLRERAPAP